MPSSPPSFTRTVLVTVALALSGLLSGCTVFGGQPPSSSSPEGGTPLDAYFGVLGSAQSSDELDAQNRAVQESVARCMKEQGFDYVADEQAGAFQFDTSSNPELVWGSEAFAKTYGYGISTDPFASIPGGPGQATDPNADYVASLSESEQAAYSEALWGALPEDDLGAEGATEAVGSLGGCMGAAQGEAESGQAYWDDPEYLALSDEIGALGEKIATAPEVVAKEKEWSDCLASAGYPGYEHKSGPQDDVVQRHNDLDPGSSISLDPSGGISRSTTDGSSGADGAGGTAGGADPAALEEVKAFEIAVATADWTCARDSGYETVSHDTRARLEQEFIDAHRSQLDALLARYGKG
ncbi:hypothetical protein [Herbiconiux solani]|uniref:hypothetical protein n=1 Tax=Herbiconiux solani TaxID=661329 RepID=UPI000826D324|nr:hypothetical protein [Herbiconiux solani]